ncbi:hypothetical protein DNTS_018781 [Danionella cerebrum]|uniref:Ras-related and estrogen-regulated growth inhibitor n=1 Tax=Danionella cerebrum TaxID=2873325 RepID=A0A553PYF1_9TELE|nr:hypothetical protein DNTS_018781 [Danionella translucida]
MAKSPEVKLVVFGRAGVGKSDGAPIAQTMKHMLASLVLQMNQTHTPQQTLRSEWKQMRSLVVRFLTKRFIWEYDPTLESTYRHQANIDDEAVSMEILDTAGQEDPAQKDSQMRWGDGFILVYDITDRGSFEEVAPLKGLLDEVKRPRQVPLVLLGNKADLAHARQVAVEEGERLAADMACAFYECSACLDRLCSGEGSISEAFHELCREIRRRRAVQGKSRRRSSTTHVKQAINKMLTKISS